MEEENEEDEEDGGDDGEDDGGDDGEDDDDNEDDGGNGTEDEYNWIWPYMKKARHQPKKRWLQKYICIKCYQIFCCGKRTKLFAKHLATHKIQVG